MTQLSRRNLMKLAGLAAGGRALGLCSLDALPAMAQSTSATDYRALVCIFLYGGNDANNMIVPADSASFEAYRSIRGALAMPQSSLQSLGSNAPVMLHAAMPNLRSMYQAGTAAVVANVGTLVRSMTREQLLAGTVPAPVGLFSHRDQANTWQTADPVLAGPVGWGGAAIDTLSAGAGGSLPGVISVAGNPMFIYGNRTIGLAVSPTATAFNPQCGGTKALCSAKFAAAQQILAMDSGATLIQAEASVGSDLFRYFGGLTDAMASRTTLQTAFPAGNGLATQLKQIAQMLSVRSSVGANRQIFFAGLGGFDTHADQMGTQAGLLSQLDGAVAAFQQALAELNLSEQVTAFTMSNFSRAMVPNSTGGTDHAWGSHQFVFGGAVKGGQTYGSMPTMVLGGPDDATGDGRWIPTLSASQYTATLASWFGIPAADMARVVPNIGNFGVTNLGFV